MNNIHNWLNTAAIVIVLAAVVLVGGNDQPVETPKLGGSTSSYLDAAQGFRVSGTTVIDSSGNVDAAVTSGSASTFASTVDITGQVTLKENVDTSITGTTSTITTAESFTTYYVGAASGTTITLPAVASSAGVHLKFVIASAFDTANVIIDSAEGDNIEGTLIVAGAVVDCDAEDQINFVNDGENLGDYVELRSDGTNWYIGDSGALTSAKLTCTDP